MAKLFDFFAKPCAMDDTTHYDGQVRFIISICICICGIDSWVTAHTLYPFALCRNTTLGSASEGEKLEQRILKVHTSDLLR